MLKSESNLRMEEITIPDGLVDALLSMLYHGNHDCLVLAVMSQGGWQFNPPSSYLLQGRDVLMVMTTPEGRTRVEELLTRVSHG